MHDLATKVVQSVPGDRAIVLFASRLALWLVGELSQEQPAATVRQEGQRFTESRARALLRAAEILDEPTWRSFQRLVENPTAVRVALFDLLQESGLAESADVAGLAVAGSQAAASGDPAAPAPTIPWLSLSVAAYAWKNGYPLQQLDPSSPPAPDSPAGQLIRRAAHFLRRQVQRGATERDKLGRRLNRPPSGAPSLEEMAQAAEAIPPLPPIFRPPVPVRYPEVARETVHLDVDEPAAPPPPSRSERLVITEEDLPPGPASRPAPVSNAPITIRPEETNPPSRPRRPPSPMPPTAVVMPSSSVESRPGFTMAVRQMLGHEEMKSTKLRVQVQDYPDGPGLYGLQVRISCAGIKSSVAGTTNREGKFVCELPVRLQSGLTYDVDVTWPRDTGGDTERKSITLNADRTEFTLPFYRKLNQPE
jgi:hypothetical protein